MLKGKVQWLPFECNTVGTNFLPLPLFKGNWTMNMLLELLNKHLFEMECWRVTLWSSRFLVYLLPPQSPFSSACKSREQFTMKKCPITITTITWCKHHWARPRAKQDQEDKQGWGWPSPPLVCPAFRARSDHSLLSCLPGTPGSPWQTWER